jgi:hypothetical protein
VGNPDFCADHGARVIRESMNCVGEDASYRDLSRCAPIPAIARGIVNMKAR